MTQQDPDPVPPIVPAAETLTCPHCGLSFQAGIPAGTLVAQAICPGCGQTSSYEWDGQ